MSQTPQTVLIADDDVDLLSTLTDLLEHEGFQVVTASEGVRVLELANKHNPDLILLDLRMPAGGGMAVLESLRTRTTTQKIPVIIVTGMPEKNLEIQAREGGAQDFVHKPYESKELISKIKNLLSKTKKGEETSV